MKIKWKAIEHKMHIDALSSSYTHMHTYIYSQVFITQTHRQSNKLKRLPMWGKSFAWTLDDFYYKILQRNLQLSQYLH